MTPTQALDALRRQLEHHGGFIDITRRGTTLSNLLARVTGFDADELVNGLDQGRRKIILINEGLGDFEPKKGDIITADGSAMAIEEVDKHTRRISGVLIGYNITAKG